jgi:hypothetical protein
MMAADNWTPTLAEQTEQVQSQVVRERLRAEQIQLQAEQERLRAERLAERLRALGVDPDEEA